MTFGATVRKHLADALAPLERADPTLAAGVVAAMVTFLGPRLAGKRRPYPVESLLAVAVRLSANPESLRGLSDLRGFVHRELRGAERPAQPRQTLRRVGESLAPPTSAHK